MSVISVRVETEYECDNCGKKVMVVTDKAGIEKYPHGWRRIKQPGRPLYMSELQCCEPCVGCMEQNSP